MDSSFKLKSFECPYHSQEAVSRVSKLPNAKKTLYCVECIMEADKSVHSSLIQMNSLIDDLYKKLSQVKIQKVNTRPPESLTSVLEDQDSMIGQVMQHISKQKEYVCNNIKEIQDEFNQTLEKV